MSFPPWQREVAPERRSRVGQQRPTRLERPCGRGNTHAPHAAVPVRSAGASGACGSREQHARSGRVGRDGNGRARVGSWVVLMVGLTGGIGAGKSTVAEMLTRRGAVVVDADLIARQVVEPGTPALAKLVDRFGHRHPRSGRIARPGRARRDRVRRRGVASATSRRSRIRPSARSSCGRSAGTADGIVVHDVPLLVESRRDLHYDGGDRRRSAAGRSGSSASRRVGSRTTTPSAGWRCRLPTRTAGRSRPGSSRTAGTSRRSKRRSKRSGRNSSNGPPLPPPEPRPSATHAND